MWTDQVNRPESLWDSTGKGQYRTCLHFTYVQQSCLEVFGDGFVARKKSRQLAAGGLMENKNLTCIVYAAG